MRWFGFMVGYRKDAAYSILLHSRTLALAIDEHDRKVVDRLGLLRKIHKR